MIQISQELIGDRAGTLLTLQLLKQESERIRAEMDRLTKLLDEQDKAFRTPDSWSGHRDSME